jgi:two-component system chemotaxis response regulator CheY
VPRAPLRRLRHCRGKGQVTGSGDEASPNHHELDRSEELNEETESSQTPSWEPPGWSRRASGSSRAPDNPNAVAILLVDDDEAFTSTEADVLRSVGYTVIKASDGGDALNLLSTMRFDAMVLDLNMPRLDGLAVLGLLSKPPPVVVVTGHELPEETRRGDLSAVVSFLRKPVPPKQLLEAVATAVVVERP